VLFANDCSNKHSVSYKTAHQSNSNVLVSKFTVNSSAHIVNSFTTHSTFSDNLLTLVKLLTG